MRLLTTSHCSSLFILVFSTSVMFVTCPAGWASDLQSGRHSFNPVQVVHTYAAVTKQYDLVSVSKP